MAEQEKVEYTIEKGIIIRSQGEDRLDVAKYNASTGRIALMDKRYRVPVIRFLNDKGHKYEGLEEESSLAEKEARNEIPPRPKMNPRVADKTPALVKWMAQHDKAAFIARYGVKELQIRTHIEKDEMFGEVSHYERSTDPVESYDFEDVVAGKQRLIADRKTCITTKMTDANENEDYDWGLDD